MIKPLSAALLMLSGAALAQNATAVCGTLVSPDDRAGCLKAVAGHSVDSGAARVCAGIATGPDKIACLLGALDKQYDGPELAVCNGMLVNRDRAHCVASNGRLLVADRRAAPTGDRVVRPTNQHRAIVDRFYWRSADQRMFREVRISQLKTNSFVDVSVPAVEIEVCVESADGYRLRFPVVRPIDQLMIAPRENHWVVGRCAEGK